MDRPRLPVEPTEIRYWPKNTRVSARVVVAGTDQPDRESGVFGVLEYLVDAAARLDQPGKRQLVIRLEPQRAAARKAGLAQQPALQIVQRHDPRFDDPAGRGSFREDLSEAGRKALQAGTGLRDADRSQPGPWRRERYPG